MQIAQSIPQGAMRFVLTGFFAAMLGIMFRACKKLSRSHFHHILSPRLYAGCGNRDDEKMEITAMNVQHVETGTPEGDALGFSADLFSGWLEMYNDNRLYLHYIISRIRGEGNVQALIRGWLDRGFDVRVVMPRPIMQHILQKFGFLPSLENIPDQYEDKVEVWYRSSVLQTDTRVRITPDTTAHA